MEMQTVQQAPISIEALKPAPIQPQWIIAGNPEARVDVLSRSLDGASVTAHWDCTAGTFDWHFDCEETVYILEGEVHVTETSGRELTLRPGDFALFHPKCVARWHVPKYVRKLAICRNSMPIVVSFAVRALNKLKSIMPINLAVSSNSRP